MTSKSKSPEAGGGDAPIEIEVEAAGAGSGAGPGDEEGESAGIAIEVEAEGEAAESETAEGEAGEGDEVAALRQKCEELETRQKETYERLLRAAADLDNYRKRARRDVEDARVDSQAKVLKEMLPVIDNLERALDHAAAGEDAADARGILEGVTLVLRQFTQAFERCGGKAIEAMHQPFDPNVHEAVGQQETAEHSPGTVVQVLQKGYFIGDRLLRPSLVVVSKAPAELPGPEETGNGRDRDPSEGNGEDRTGVEEESGSVE
jgi:molecular chaperone GrpE